jgi:hypothetical protein
MWELRGKEYNNYMQVALMFGRRTLHTLYIPWKGVLSLRARVRVRFVDEYVLL